ncbi:MAG: S8 family serine peptidase [Hyphomonadaceae bacterium]
MRPLIGAALILALTAASAFAQLLPSLPDTVRALPGAVEGAARDTLNTARELTRVRENLARDLLRQHRRELEADPNGAPIVRREIVAFAPTAVSLAAARAAGFTIARETRLEGLDAAFVVLRPPEGISTPRALRRLREADPTGLYDFNHLYLPSGAPHAARSRAMLQRSESASAGGPPIGLIDGGAPANLAPGITTRGFAGAVRETAHGAAVASLILSAAPNARLFAADVYGASPTGGSAEALAQAFAWMARERVGVINVSLVGPANRTMEALVRAMIARGHIIVAAVGNDGPAAAPLYPASYPSVVGVTAVDARRRALPEAGRGVQVDFAALGISQHTQGGRTSSVRGTSYAAPIVAGLLARRLNHPDPAQSRAAIAALSASAIDLGERGRDRTYGAGLVGQELNLAQQR